MVEPLSPQKAPCAVTVETGKRCAWYACGRGDTQPSCDGSHKITDIVPVVFAAEQSGGVYPCGCKHTGTPLYRNGTHSAL
jgi:hypothetical protein